MLPGTGIRSSKTALLVALAAASLLAAEASSFTTDAQARSSYFTSRGCKNCHSKSTSTCTGCHHHSGTLTASKNKTTPYQPREKVTITLNSSGARPGWISARLYDHLGTEIARSAGDESGKGGSTTFPAVISAPAPKTPGKYTWSIACFGNANGSGMGDVHREKVVKVPITVAAQSAQL